MTRKQCVSDIKSRLSSLPHDWAEKISCHICDILSQDECDTTIDCKDIKSCETLTELSDFTLVDDKVCITYTDEHRVHVKRCFTINFTDVINNTNGYCISSIWGVLNPTEKWQAIIDKICNCCNPTTTTTTTSTTTTTTIGPCNCMSWQMTNLDTNSHTFNYLNCEDGPVSETLVAGQSSRFCACYRNIEYDPQYLLLSDIADGCTSPIDCETCNSYVVTNDNSFPVEVFYVDCNTTLPASIWALPAVKTLIPCACTGTVESVTGVTIGPARECSGTTTTTTTTSAPCSCYMVYNSGSVNRWVGYTDCEGLSQGFTIIPLQTSYVCAANGSLSAFGCTITNMGYCFDGCNPTITSTTTTTTAIPCLLYKIIGPDDLGIFDWSYLNCEGHLVTGTIGPDEQICVNALQNSITGDPGVTWEEGC